MKTCSLDKCKRILLSYLKVPPVGEDIGGFICVNHPLIGMLSNINLRRKEEIKKKALLTEHGWERFKSYVKEELYDEINRYNYYELALCLQDSYIVDYLLKAEKYMPNKYVVSIVKYLIGQGEQYLEPYDKLSALLRRVRNTEPENDIEKEEYAKMYGNVDETIAAMVDYVYRAVPEKDYSKEKKDIGPLWNYSWIDEVSHCHTYGNKKVYKIKFDKEAALDGQLLGKLFMDYEYIKKAEKELIILENELKA